MRKINDGLARNKNPVSKGKTYGLPVEAEWEEKDARPRKSSVNRKVVNQEEGKKAQPQQSKFAGKSVLKVLRQKTCVSRFEIIRIAT